MKSSFIPPLDERKLRDLCADFTRRIHAGEPVRAETILEQCTDLDKDENAVLEIIYSEHVAREDLGEKIQPEAWYERFPHLRDRLHRLLEFHRLFGNQGESISLEEVDPLPADKATDFVLDSANVRERPAFEILEEIGRGGMGVVYKARQVALDRIVALKTILTGSYADPREYRQFQVEAEAIACLQHPNILQIFDVTERDGLPHLVLEYVDGKNLAEWQKDLSPQLEWSVRLIETLALAIHHAHRRGIIHRDLKPANVLIASDGTPKISDFGLAKFISDNIGGTLTGNRFLGTPHYMAPELVTGRSSEVGPAVDVYALGAILYELLVGVPRLSGTTPLEAIRRAVEDVPKPPSSLRAGVPRDLDTICLKCLEREPSRRYASAADLAEDLRRFLAGEPILARPPSTRERLVKWARRRPSEAALVGLGLMVMVGVLSATAWSNAWLRRHGRHLEAALEREHEQSKIARQERLRAVQNEQLAHRQRYDSQIRLAQNAWDSGHVELAQELLLEQRPEADEVDFRSFDWFYLQNISHRDVSILSGHSAPVTTQAFSPDGSLFASGDSQGNVVLTDLARGRQWAMKGQHSLRALHLAFSPDGRILASGASTWKEPGEVKLWDTQTGREWSTLPGTRGIVERLVFSEDGRTLVVLEKAKFGRPLSLRFWDISQGPQYPALARSIDDRTRAVSIARRSLMATLDIDGRICIRDVATGEARTFMEGTYSNAGNLVLSDDASRVAVGFADRRVEVWDWAKGKSWSIFRELESPVSLNVFSPDAKFLAMCDGLDGFTVCELATGRKWSVRVSVNDSAGPLMFSPDGRRLISEEREFTKLWNVATGAEIGRIPGHVDHTAYSPDGHTVALCGDYPRIRLWHLDPRPIVTALAGHGAEVWTLAFSPDGRTLASGADDNTVVLWNLEDGQKRETLRGHEATVSTLAFSPDGRMLASAELSPRISLWDLASGQEEASLVGHTHRVRSVIFSPDGKTLASAGSDQEVRLWDLASRRCRKTFTEHNDTLRAVAFSPDGRFLASSGADGKVVLRDLANPDRTRSWHASAQITSLAFSPDGSRLAAGGENRTVAIWNVAEARPAVILRGHLLGVRTVAFSPDGQTLASAGEDRTVRLWDPVTGQERLTLRGHLQQVNALAFSPDGTLLASGSHDGAIKLWHAPRGR